MTSFPVSIQPHMGAVTANSGAATVIIIIIIIINRTDLGGVMSKDCKDTVHTLKTVTKRDCDAKE